MQASFSDIFTMKPNERFARYLCGMKEPRRLTLYEEVWECRFRTEQEFVEESDPKPPVPKLAKGLERSFEKVESETQG